MEHEWRCYLNVKFIRRDADAERSSGHLRIGRCTLDVSRIRALGDSSLGRGCGRFRFTHFHCVLCP